MTDNISCGAHKVLQNPRLKVCGEWSKPMG
nr:MAG TPA: hypothetical protein [Caudoviricetes sp.]